MSTAKFREGEALFQSFLTRLLLDECVCEEIIGYGHHFDLTNLVVNYVFNQSHYFEVHYHSSFCCHRCLSANP